MILIFLKSTQADFGNFSTDDAWPLIIIEFEEWAKNQ